MFVYIHNIYLSYGGRIYRKNRYSKEIINIGINYICKAHRENENKRKNKSMIELKRKELFEILKKK